MHYLLLPFEGKEFLEIFPYNAGRAQQLQRGKFFCRTNREHYIDTVNALLKHIHRGDIYEINYCIEFFATGIVIDPEVVFRKLQALTEAPFAGLYQIGDTVIICASPERFIKRTGNLLLTQPMKGTARRGRNEEEDVMLKQQLASSLKEQTENVMAVDVARNDLSRIAKRGSVKTTELFGVHTFRNVHQMISTVTCELPSGSKLSEIADAVFPPASMTGAPKISACKLIKKYELSPRGYYSGCLGWMKENGDFDFCVVIRSLIYYPKTQTLSFHVGSAITAAAEPAQEWEECLLKAQSLMEALGENLQSVQFSA